jgi:hypothetical protein
MTLLEPQLRIDSQDQFYIENHNDAENLRFVWNKYEYVIQPGYKKIVPFEVVCLYYGDPRSVAGRSVPYRDSRGAGVVPDRRAEVMRLAVRYGVYEQGAANIREAIKDENKRLAKLNEESIFPITPLRDENFGARITTLDGIEVFTPLIDHEGLYSYGFTADEQKSDDLAAIIKDYEKRLEALEGTKDVLDKRGDNTDDGIPIDNPGDPVGEGIVSKA